MGSASWPRTPSPAFDQWAGEFEVWRRERAHRSLRRDDGQSVQQYYAHGGLDEVSRGGDLEWMARTEREVQRSQRIVWDAHAREVVAAAAEGGLDATAEVLRESREWIRRLERESEPVDERSKVAGLVRELLEDCPDNPLIKAEEIWGLWEDVAGARRIAERLRDRLLEELEEDGYPRTKMAQGMGWSYSRIQRHLLRLEGQRMDRVQRVRQGEVPGVIDLGSRRATGKGPVDPLS